MNRFNCVASLVVIISSQIWQGLDKPDDIKSRATDTFSVSWLNNAVLSAALNASMVLKFLNEPVMPIEPGDNLQ